MYKNVSRFRQTLRDKGVPLTGGTGSGGRALHKSAGHGKPKSKTHKTLDAAATARQERAVAEVAEKPWKLVPKAVEQPRAFGPKHQFSSKRRRRPTL